MSKGSLIMASLLIAALIISGTSNAAPAGFLWYNLAKPEAKPKKKGTDFKRLSYTDKDAVLRFYTMEALHKVRFTKKMADERVFLALQDYWLREATAHGRLNQKTLLYYPQYDYSVTHPTSTIGSQLQDSMRERNHQSIIEGLSKTHGLLFFYRAKNPYDQRQIPIVQDFCRTHALSLIPISVDGAISSDIPDTRHDSGQAARLGVRYFPALLLVNPKTQKTFPLAFGLTTQDVLKTRLVAVANNFKGESA